MIDATTGTRRKGRPKSWTQDVEEWTGLRTTVSAEIIKDRAHWRDLTHCVAGLCSRMMAHDVT